MESTMALTQIVLILKFLVLERTANIGRAKGLKSWEDI